MAAIEVVLRDEWQCFSAPKCCLGMSQGGCKKQSGPLATAARLSRIPSVLSHPGYKTGGGREPKMKDEVVPDQ